eukprot:TRINITY_DN9909_c0_g1_i1.p2 TRINITY_DN9909_c0_g1~~TRINITY_DN9909_c0_g1_i1.p2  ORF type:complete len:135 (-),score=42.05 TRINITY_DN9909_c0_g1_i1:172-549(-)
MAKGRDVTDEYGAPDGHKIVEILNYRPDASYRGKYDIRHLVIWTFGEHVVHITNGGAMAKGRDVTDEYGAPDGHKIVEILNYRPDASYRGKYDIRHLVIWTFGEHVVHITNGDPDCPFTQSNHGA